MAPSTGWTQRLPSWGWIAVVGLVLVGVGAALLWLTGGDSAGSSAGSSVAQLRSPSELRPQLPEPRFPATTSGESAPGATTPSFPGEEPRPPAAEARGTADPARELGGGATTVDPTPTVPRVEPEPLPAEKVVPPASPRRQAPTQSSRSEPPPPVAPARAAAEPPPVEPADPPVSKPRTADGPPSRAALPRAEVRQAPAAVKEVSPEVKSGPATVEPPPPEPAETRVAEASRDVAPTSAPARPEPTPAPRVQRGDLVRLIDVDQTPVPRRRPLPTYPPIARRLRLQGTVVLRVLVDERGRVADVELVSGVDNKALDQAALGAARDWTYEPAVDDGVAVKVWVTERVVFRL